LFITIQSKSAKPPLCYCVVFEYGNLKFWTKKILVVGRQLGSLSYTTFLSVLIWWGTASITKSSGIGGQMTLL